MSLDAFHPAVARWFRKTFDAPTPAQERGWPAIRDGRHTLIAAPTGSGKTLAAFLASIDDLVRRGLAGDLEDGTRVVYVSPLKALSNDIHRNLEIPLQGIASELSEDGDPGFEIRTAVRTGDTSQSARRAMVERPPHILVTTPESLYLLLTSDGGRDMLRTAVTAIVDEIHAVADDKRGSHLALTLERLEHLVGEGGLLRIGLSATQRPIDRVARFLVGAGNLDDDGAADCTIVDVGTRRDLDLHVEMPRSPLEAVMAAEVWEELYDRVAALIEEHETTLVFVNTRRITERVTKHLAERVGEEAVGAHHGSLSTEQRLEAERRLKAGELKALVATASLELGIDIGAVDLVVQLGSPRSISTLLQRVGRASHHVGGRPEGRLFPLSRDDLVECVALVDAARRGELDRLVIPDKPVDILAQQIVACAASREWTEAELYDLVRRAWPFRDLTRAEFDDVVEMLAQGFTTRRGRRGAYLHWDAVNGILRGRRGARLTALTCGGAIPDTFEFQVVQEPQGIQVGTVDEEFSVESLPGDIFQLGNTSWRILKVEGEKVLVEDARGQPPTIPFWFGEAPGRTRELSEAVSRIREEVALRLADGGGSGDRAGGREAAVEWLVDEVGVGAVAARAAVEYLAVTETALGAMPSRETLVIERFFDEAGDMHLVVHSPYGQRVNRAWGLALRKVFCRTFNFELQAAATDDAVVLSLGPTHSFPLADVFEYLKPGQVLDKLVQAFLDAPMFPVRWRWNASRALAIKRFYGGRRVPPQLQRMDAEDLLAVVFPDQLACLENIQGDREIPDHPLVDQTIRDCLEEAMDFEEFEELLGRIAEGRVRRVARDVREPSPMAHEVLAARPYAFLDDAPAEERRTLAVQTRRFLDVDSADELSALDAEAIDRVRREAWPEPEGAEELHDALVLHGYLTEAEAGSDDWRGWLGELVEAGRVTRLLPAEGGPGLWVAAERVAQARSVYEPEAREPSWEPELELPARLREKDCSPDPSLTELVRGRLMALGPVRVADLAGELGLGEGRVERAMLALEAEGFAFRGRFTVRGEGEEWCERRLLSRIHRYTLNRLRSEIEPVSRGDFMEFLLAWHRLLPQERAEGPGSLEAILEQLEGFEAAAAAWEGEILPARLLGYDPVWLDTLCLSGRFAWARLSPPGTGPRSGGRGGPVRSTPVALLSRERLPHCLRLAGAGEAEGLSSGAREVAEVLRREGASFFADLGRRCGLLPAQLEDALGELVAGGLVTADGFTGLRALLVPASRKTREGARKGAAAVLGMDDAGRWSLLERPEAEDGPADRDEVEAVARLLLRRYGVVFRRLLLRETNLPPWRDLLRAYHRLEARGDIRGGRFVSGFSGQQFVLPEAVGKLRAVRRRRRDEARETPVLVSISAADPLNLVGIVTPGDRLPAVASNRVLFRDGVPLAVRRSGEVRFLEEVEAAARWKLEKALVRRSVPPQLRAYLGRPA